MFLKKLTRISLFFLILIVSSSITVSAITTQETLVVVTNKGLGEDVSNIVTLEDVIALYAMKKKLLPNGNRATLLAQPFDTQASIMFSQHLFNSFPYQIKRRWDVAVFSGRAIRPLMLENNDAVLNSINSNKDAIGYVLVDSTKLNFLKENYHVIAIFN